MAKANTIKKGASTTGAAPNPTGVDECLEKARELSVALKTPRIYGNSKGEFFTREDYALLSDSKENIRFFDFTNEVNNG